MAGKGLQQGGPVTYEHNSGAHDPRIGRVSLSRPLVILAIIAAVALLAGFLAFGGANMGQ